MTEDKMVTDSMHVSLSKLQETLKDRGAWCAEVHEVASIYILLHGEYR